MNISKRKQGILAIICTIAMIVTSITVYNPREVKAGQSDAASYDYSSIEWLGDGAGGGKYNNKYKLAPLRGVSNIANIQKPGFATADGIYMALATADVKKVTVNGTETSEYDMQEAGMLLHLATMTEKYNDILIYNSNGEAFAELYGYYADGTDSGTVEPVEKPAAPADLKVSFNEEEKTCTISFDEVEGITTYNFYVGARKIGTVPENKTFKISDLNVEEGKEYTFGVTSVNAENVESNKATTKATVPVFSALSAPTQIYANINPDQTDYTVGVVQAVAGAEGYNFYINGKFAKTIAKDQVITIKEMEEKYGLKRGEVNKFGISAFNSKGESAITTIDVPVPEKKEDTTTPTPDYKDGEVLVNESNKTIEVPSYSDGDSWRSEYNNTPVKYVKGKKYVAEVVVSSTAAKEIKMVFQRNSIWDFVDSNSGYEVRIAAGNKVKITYVFEATQSTDDGNFDIHLGSAADATTLVFESKKLTTYNEVPDGVKTGVEVLEAPGTTKYTVSIDGTEKQYEEGATITVPADGQGYYDVTKKLAYAPGAVLPVNENMTLKSIELNVTMTPGASIRLAAPTGLRFQTTVKSGNGIAADEILNSTTVTTGTLITTLDLYEANGKTLTKDSKSTYTVLDIANDGWFGEESKKETGKFCGSIIKIQRKNYGREFIAVGYATINYSNGDTKTVYAEVTENNAKSIEYVASKVQKSAAYKNNYTDAQKAIIDKYIKGEEISE